MSDIPYWPKNAKGQVKFVCHNFVYASDGEEGGMQFTTEANAKALMDSGFMSKDSEVLYEVEAGSWVEAMQEHYRRQGFGTYVPMDEPEDA